jgi:SAM-dependent methyltransferase
MDSEIARRLRCPTCGAPLKVGDVMARCDTGHEFPVEDGVPSLYDDARLGQGQDATARAFGYSWTHYPADNPYTEEQWADWIEPLTAGDFKDKLVLDAGCGLGGFTEYAARWGARRVVGIDLSEAVAAANRRIGHEVDLFQADLHHPPFEPGAFDLAYSIGVLHHLPDPEAGFASVCTTVRPGGQVFAWVYGREGNGWIIWIVDPLRRAIFRHLPHPFLKWAIALPLAAVVWSFALLARRAARLPYGDYLRWLAKRDFAFVHGVVFDHLVAPTSHYTTREDFAAWFERAGLVDVTITPRNANSWRGLGRVPG